MSTQLSPRVTEYFARNDAAAQWWKVDYRSGGRYRKQLEFIRRTVDVRGKRTLDVATGLARFAIDFAKNGAAEVVAVDISASMVELARENAAQFGVADKIDFRVGNAADVKLEQGYFDVISLMEVLVHLPDPAGVMQSLVQYLKPGGYFITNYDTPNAPKVTYPIDYVWSIARGLLKSRKTRDVVMLETVDETIEQLENYHTTKGCIQRDCRCRGGSND
jgi:ubiquinone/menaquinone biosynthesis C-methylase UbiE